MALEGADVTNLPSIADDIDNLAGTIQSHLGTIHRLIGEVKWQGRDATAFKNDWEDIAAPLNAFVGKLNGLAGHLIIQISDQERTSDNLGAVGGTVAPSLIAAAEGSGLGLGSPTLAGRTLAILGSLFGGAYALGDRGYQLGDHVYDSQEYKDYSSIKSWDDGLHDVGDDALYLKYWSQGEKDSAPTVTDILRKAVTGEDSDVGVVAKALSGGDDAKDASMVADLSKYAPIAKTGGKALGVVGGVASVAMDSYAANKDWHKDNNIQRANHVSTIAVDVTSTAFMVAPNPVTAVALGVSGVAWAGTDVAMNWHKYDTAMDHVATTVSQHPVQAAEDVADFAVKYSPAGVGYSLVKHLF
jgi:hypothetical protein